jgi:predicted  nucleic acid-binding Zn-ribbon protein
MDINKAKNMVEDLQKRVTGAREYARASRLALERVSKLLESVRTESDLLRGDIERLEQEFVILEDDRNRWRKAFLEQAEVLRSKGKDND